MRRQAHVLTNIRLPEDLLFDLRSIAIEEGISMSSLIRHVMSEYRAAKRRRREARSL